MWGPTKGLAKSEPCETCHSWHKSLWQQAWLRIPVLLPGAQMKGVASFLLTYFFLSRRSAVQENSLSDSILQQLLWHGMHFASISLIDLLHWESRVFYQHSLNITKSFFFINLLLIISEIFLLLNLFLACICNDSFQRLSQNIKVLNIKCSSYWFSWSCSWLYGFHSSDFSLSIYIHRFSLG